jgi:hypothetical protein
VRIIKIRSNEIHSKICVGNYLSVIFSKENGLKQGDVLSPLLFTFSLEYSFMKDQEN